MSNFFNISTWLFPTEKNVIKFLDNAVFYKENHALKGKSKRLIIDYELYVLKNHVDKAQKPYAMSPKELSRVSSEVYLVLGEKDMLFPAGKSKTIAEQYIKSLKKVYMLPDTGHGIETSPAAISIIEKLMEG